MIPEPFSQQDDRNHADLGPVYRVLGQLEGRVHGIESALSDMKMVMSSNATALKELCDTVNLLRLDLTKQSSTDEGSSREGSRWIKLIEVLFNAIVAFVCALVAVKYSAH